MTAHWKRAEVAWDGMPNPWKCKCGREKIPKYAACKDCRVMARRNHPNFAMVRCAECRTGRHLPEYAMCYMCAAARNFART